MSALTPGPGQTIEIDASATGPVIFSVGALGWPSVDVTFTMDPKSANPKLTTSPLYGILTHELNLLCISVDKGIREKWSLFSYLRAVDHWQSNCGFENKAKLRTQMSILYFQEAIFMFWRLIPITVQLSGPSGRFK